jgi:phosphopantetheine--protein transferase-like protein
MDLVSVDDVEESLRLHGDRWLERVFTAEEIGACRAPGGVSRRRLAARFAAKEAALKVLRTARDEAIPWRAIEVHEGPGGAQLRLGTPAAALAEAAGLSGLTLGVTHRGAFAAAIVVAEQAGTRAPGTNSPTDTQGLSRSTRKPMTNTVHDEIRRVVGDHARLAIDPAALAADADLYEAGMTSHASVNVMLALEDAFDVEFPDRMLKRDVFESIDSIAAAVTELQAGVT